MGEWNVVDTISGKTMEGIADLQPISIPQLRARNNLFGPSQVADLWKRVRIG